MEIKEAALLLIVVLLAIIIFVRNRIKKRFNRQYRNI